ncbi:MAG: FAD binding domain-containing protein [Candidatus Promineifilaceae bacterium]
MPQRPAAYHRPSTLEEALRLLAEPGSAPLAGGARLLAGHAPRPLVDLQDLGLAQIEIDAGRLRLGAMTRLADVVEYLGAGPEAADMDGPLDLGALLAKAVFLAGPNTFRNTATVGGSIAARPADSELLAVLLALEAELLLAAPAERTLTLNDYLVHEERPGGLLISVSFARGEGLGAAVRVARTRRDYPIVAVVAWQPENGRPRLAATGLGPRPARLIEAEGALAAGVSPKAIERAASAARDAARHPGDFRGSAGYRAEMAAVLTRRALGQIYKV